MIVTCNHCFKEQEARVTREKPHKIQCNNCGKTIDNINNFMVASLVSQKKFVSEDKGGFSFYCDSCNGVHKGVLVKDKKDRWVKCTNCNAQMKNISDFMLRQMSTLNVSDETK